MNITPPHLIDEEAEAAALDFSHTRTFSKYGSQGPSKYGKGGSRAYKALGRAGKKK